MEVSPEEWWKHVHPEDRSRVRDEIDAYLERRTEAYTSEHRLIHVDGGEVWVRSRAEAIWDDDSPKRFAGSISDITKQRLAEEQLRHDASHDGLTGLPNRAFFMDHLDRLLKRAQITHSDHLFAVLFLDFDRFKRVNDSLGHLAGDRLLRAAARRLTDCLRPSDTVARLGGDEFAILLDRVRDVTDATRVSERIHQALKAPFNLSGLEVFATVSIGIAIGDRTYERADDILRDADTAMYRAKAAGRSRHEVFNEAMHARALEQLTMEIDLRRAVNREEFRLYYQPIVSLPDGAIRGIEVFTWWEHPAKGMLPPSAFLAAAEESGLIVDIGWWVLREACEQMQLIGRRYPRHPGAEELSLHVNVSDKQLVQPEIVDRIEDTLRATGLDPERLVLDISENVIMKKAETSVAILGQLKSLPLRIHLDDFGTGYSSLGYLHRFQIDALKIDRSFIRHLRAEGENRTTVQTIVNLADNLGMDVIAEGVENDAQLQELLELSCRFAQGSLFHEPLRGDELETLLAQPRRAAGF
jgi:diguanylate cyclase (GGDEF)-like protein